MVVHFYNINFFYIGFCFLFSCMKSFLEECKRVLTSKVQCVRQSKEEHLSMLTDFEQKLLQLEEKRKEVNKNLMLKSWLFSISLLSLAYFLFKLFRKKRSRELNFQK